jgi:hypothetical protein
MRPAFVQQIAAEQRWLDEHRAAYDAAGARLADPAALRTMLEHCRSAELTLECYSGTDSGEKACYLVGRASAELARGLDDLRLVRTFEKREAAIEAMKQGGEMPDLGLGMLRTVV